MSSLLLQVGHIAEPSSNIEGGLVALRGIEVQVESQLIGDATLVFTPVQPYARSVPETIDE